MSNNLTKRQIVQSIYENNNYKQEDVRQIVQQTLDIVRDALIAVATSSYENSAYLKFKCAKPA